MVLHEGFVGDGLSTMYINEIMEGHYENTITTGRLPEL